MLDEAAVDPNVNVVVVGACGIDEADLCLLWNDLHLHDAFLLQRFRIGSRRQCGVVQIRVAADGEQRGNRNRDLEQCIPSTPHDEPSVGSPPRCARGTQLLRLLPAPHTHRIRMRAD